MGGDEHGVCWRVAERMNDFVDVVLDWFGGQVRHVGSEKVRRDGGRIYTTDDSPRTGASFQRHSLEGSERKDQRYLELLEVKYHCFERCRARRATWGQILYVPIRVTEQFPECVIAAINTVLAVE